MDNKRIPIGQFDCFILMTLCLVSKSEADLALVVNKEEYVYKAHTVLTLDQAYNNARLLAKPDREWLNP